VTTTPGRGMTLHLKVWRQKDRDAEGRLVDYDVADVQPDMSFLEMMDILNERLIASGEEPVAFEHDCREGICGTCSMVIDGAPHGGRPGTTTCQLYMRHFKDGATIHVEPWRATPFPILRDLCVDRSAFDRIQQAGGFVSMSTGNAPEANALPVSKDTADAAMDAAQCIGCGACVAACKNASAMLFVAAKVGHLSLLPQGQPERQRRALSMVRAMDGEGFGSCTNYSECEAACPKEISVSYIARLNREFVRATLSPRV
jgi:succinate dehydrogenase / fumarate reductase iron-sulfur subunit